MRNAVLVLALCVAVALAAWGLASAEGRVDADERVSAMLPPPGRQALWEPGEAVQSVSFGLQAALGVAVLGLALTRMRRRAG